MAYRKNFVTFNTITPQLEAVSIPILNTFLSSCLVFLIYKVQEKCLFVQLSTVRGNMGLIETQQPFSKLLRAVAHHSVQTNNFTL